MRWFLRLLLCVSLVVPAEAWACGAIAGRARVMRAAAGDDAVRITFLGHASFHIVTPGGIAAVTDYSGDHVPPAVPDVVTMNHAHATHFTDVPDRRIRHVLRGWSTDGKPPEHDLRVGDLRVRNLPTNIRAGAGATEYYGNSVFVFEAAGLCIAHLGHLHHLLTADDLAVLGPIDIVMAPVDGTWTLDAEGMAEVLRSLRPRLVLPMHYFSSATLERFLARARAEYEIIVADRPDMTVSRATLPDRPQVRVLPGPLY